MKFTAKKTEVMEALKKAAYCTNRGTLPILANALFDADPETGKVRITCNNLEQCITTEFAAEIERGGKTTIPAKRLQAILGAMPAAPVKFDTDKKTYHTTVECGTAKVTLLGITPVDFPELAINKEETRFTIEYKELLRLIKHAGYAINLKDSRKVLHGMLMELDGSQITAISTDSKRIAGAFSVRPEPFPERKQYIIPLAALDVLKTLQAESIEVVCSNKFAVFKSEAVHFTTKLVEGQYPNITAFTSMQFQYTAQIDGKTLLDKLTLIQQIGAECMECALTDESLTIKAENASNGTVIDSMDIVPGGTAIEPQSMYFNPVFITDTISVCADDKEVTFRFNNPLAPVKFEFADGSFYFIMPMNPNKGGQTPAEPAKPEAGK